MLVPVFSYSMEEKDWKRLVNRELFQVSRSTVSAWRCFSNGRVSMINSVNAYFGITVESTVVARRSIELRKLTPKMLESCQRNGKALTRVICKYPGSTEVFVFETPFDRTLEDIL